MILERIIAAKRKEVAGRRQAAHVSALRDRPLYGAPRRPFGAALAAAPAPAVIAELKRASPSRGTIRSGYDVAELAQGLAEGLPHGRIVEDADARDFGRLLRPCTPHLGRKQQAGTTDQGSELTPSHVGHGPTSCRGVTTSNRRTLLYAQPSRRVPASPWARPELF